jgi:hypothetical protein
MVDIRRSVCAYVQGCGAVARQQYSGIQLRRGWRVRALFLSKLIGPVFPGRWLDKGCHYYGLVLWGYLGGGFTLEMTRPCILRYSQW